MEFLMLQLSRKAEMPVFKKQMAAQAGQKKPDESAYRATVCPVLFGY